MEPANERSIKVFFTANVKDGKMGPLEQRVSAVARESSTGRPTSDWISYNQIALRFH